MVRQSFPLMSWLETNSRLRVSAKLQGAKEEGTLRKWGPGLPGCGQDLF